MKQLYYNGKIYVSRNHFSDAMLIEGERIVQVGSLALLQELLQGELCELFDLQGKTVIPALNDSHCHLLHLGESLCQVRLAGARSIAELIARGKAFLQAHPDTIFLKGTGWNQDSFTDDARMPTRYDLEEISREIPIVFSRACGHICVANSKALAIAGVTASTQAVPGGVIYTDEQGEPNGLFSENAMGQIESIAPEHTPTQIADYLKEAMAYCAQFGIVSVQTADIRQENTALAQEGYRLLYETYPDALRTYQQTIFTDVEAYRTFVEANNVTGIGDMMYKIGPLKLFVDGSLGARTAWMRKPYHDDGATCGVPTMTREALDDMIAIAEEHGCQVAIHCIGDAAIEMTLNAYQKVCQGDNVLRHGIVHCQITDDALLQRFVEQNVLAYLQPIFIHCDMNVVYQRVGDILAEQSYRFGDLYRMGVHTAYGTDAPVEDANPYQNIYCAVTRKSLDGAKTYLPSQKVDIYDAIDQYTIGSAYMSFEENEKGRLQAGYLADFAVLDADIFTISEEEIQSVRPIKTVRGGRVIFAY